MMCDDIAEGISDIDWAENKAYLDCRRPHFCFCCDCKTDIHRKVWPYLKLNYLQINSILDMLCPTKVRPDSK